MEKYVNELFDYIKNSQSVYHNIETNKNILKNLDYTELKENEEWELKKGKGYFVVRSDASIIMFKLPEGEVKGYSVVASHNDSPSFKLKPTFDYKQGKYSRINTEVYGGPIALSWFDKPLSVAGRILIKDAEGNVVSRLVDMSGHTFIIPSLAPHLGRMDPASLTLQNDYLPLVASGDANTVMHQIEHINVYEGEKVLAHDLFLYCKETPMVAGIDNKLICSPKLDDLECAFSSFEAFLEAKPVDKVSVCVIFNNEEVGSGSNNAAGSTFLTDVLERISDILKINKYIAYSNSMLVSADNAHAVHPAHPEKTDPTNGVYMNEGIVIKQSASLSYTTDAISSSRFKNILDKANIPYQDFANNSNVRGGSTLGYIALHQLSIVSVDIGLAQLSMHSTYETAGAKDIAYMVKGLKAFYEA